ncbi:MAG TPA: ABC transporter permease subunit [Solirubrobacteraceae bacterium]|jgi:putative spermidine/putrescine transport system permease protein|nr:ABC transporter permease subunit [Solirubrobacteraceae bacterium]
MSVAGGGGPGAVGAGALLAEIEEPPAPPRRARRGKRLRPWRVVILVLALLFFLTPLIASIKYSLLQLNGSYGFDNYTQIISNSALRSALFTSLEIAGISAFLVVALLLPTVVLVRLKLPKLTLLMEGVTILPIVVPPIVIAAGLAQLQGSAPTWMVHLWFNHPLTALTPVYVVLAMPFSYRAFDTGVRAIDLRTLVDASRSLGASWFTTLTRVVLPNVETAMLGAIFLTIAFCMGEVVIATILLYVTLPVEMIQVSSSSPGVTVALSVLSLVLVFLLLFSLSFLAGRRRGSTSVRVI